jgi:DNA-binding NarL/FixJ family response regulator
MHKILIVEDNTSFRYSLKELLAAQFPLIPIEEAGDGDEAMQKFDSFHPDLVFMDIKLPGESGLELTRKMKLRYPEMKVVVLTSYDLPEYREAAARNGANQFLVKGTSTREEILKLVESLLTEGDQTP